MKVIIDLELGDNETPLDIARRIEEAVMESLTEDRYILNEDKLLVHAKRSLKVVGIE